MLSVQNLSISFPMSNETVHAVRDVSFDIKKGETVALVGESGSGKSVTALSILRLLSAGRIFGKIMWEGNDLLQATEKDMRRIRGNDIAMIFQEPMTALNPLHSIGRQISEVLYVHKRMTRTQARKRVAQLLELVELESLQNRLDAFPHQLSGGQRQRVMIAMALANEPKLLIADEPTTALDVTVQAEILALLKDLQQKMDMALLLISHDLGVVKHMAHRIGVMQRGDLVEFGPADQVLGNPRHPYTQKLLGSKPSGQAAPLADDAPVLLTAENVGVTFTGSTGFFGFSGRKDVRAVDDASFILRQGETLGIVGESGSGKTTLALAVLRLLTGTGKIVYQGHDLNTLNQTQMRPLRKSLQIVFQDPFGSLSPRMTVESIIAEGLAIHEPRMGRAERDAKLIQAMEDVQLDPTMRHRYPHEFSGGQRQRISLARALILDPRILVLDEPTSALDVSIQAQIVDLLRKIQREKGLAYLFISHDLRVVRALAHRIVVMKEGRIVETGDRDMIFTAPAQEYTQKLLAAALG